MAGHDEQFEAEVAALIQDEFAQARQQAHVPPAELVWMRAQIRAREEAARRVIRPLVVGQSLGVAALVGLLAALVRHFPVAALPPIPLGMAAVVLATWLVLAPVALYFALARD